MVIETLPTPAPLAAETLPIPAPLVGAISQEDWEATPAILQSEICRMFRELSAGIEKYRPAAERDAGLAEFHATAVKNGTTLAAVMRRYINLENLLRADPTAGILAICENMGLEPLEFFSHYLATRAA